MNHLCKTRRPTSLTLVCAALLVAACGGSDGTSPGPRRPVITVQGISDGEVVTQPVTITISVDVGTYTATLDDETFFSGRTVAEPGVHVLRVEARNQGATSQKVVSFEIQFGGGSVLIIRLFDLGDNSAGGGGDAILLTDSTAAGQRHMLIDAGPAGADGADRDFVQDKLAALGVDTLEALLLTHGHSDHFDGMADILRETRVRSFYYNGQVRAFSRYQEVLTLAGTRAEERVAVGTSINFDLGFSGATDLSIVPPLSTHLTNGSANSSEMNDGSLGTALSRGSFRMFFTGDGEVAANQRWRTQFASRTSNLTALKVGHHGANDAVFDNGSSGSSAWLGHTEPELQVISANGASHPRIRAINLLSGRANTSTYCTNVHGVIEIRVDAQGAYVVSVEKNAGMDCVPGVDATS